LLVTNRRILWKETSVELATATGYREVTQFHRYAIRLRHAPVERRERAPAHRVLWWHWGNTTRSIQATETGFAFSHRDTDAARAIRRRLSELGIEPGERITMPRTRPRDEGKAYFQLATRRQLRRSPRMS
jgi:Fe2+ transport system protein FeoA